MSKTRTKGPAEVAALNDLNRSNHIIDTGMTADEEIAFLNGMPAPEGRISETGEGYIAELNEATRRKIGNIGLTATQSLELDDFATRGDRTQDEVDTYRDSLLNRQGR
jgi:hypothetical protein